MTSHQIQRIPKQVAFSESSSRAMKRNVIVELSTITNHEKIKFAATYKDYSPRKPTTPKLQGGESNSDLVIMLVNARESHQGAERGTQWEACVNPGS